MGSHPVNLAIRFLLEVSALLVMGVWGWRSNEDWPRFVLAIGIPIVIAAVWGTFAVPGDPSRSGSAPVAVPGILRIVIELSVFVLAVLALSDLGYIRSNWIFGIIILIHYMLSYDRILWLIKH